MNLSIHRPAVIAGGIVLIFLTAWESTVHLLKFPVYLLPAPSRVFRTLFDHPLLYLEASAYTLGEALAGLLLGVLAGTILAALLTLFPGIEDGVMTLAILIKSTPLVAIAPLLTLWLGFGVLPKILITALLTFFPVLVNVLSGLQRIDRPLMDLFHSYHASRWEIFRYLRIPLALPYLFAALKISTPLALIGAVVAEWSGASNGLGHMMWLAYSNLNLPFMFAATFILAAAGMLLYQLVLWTEQRVIFWQTLSSED